MVISILFEGVESIDREVTTKYKSINEFSELLKEVEEDKIIQIFESVV